MQILNGLIFKDPIISISVLFNNYENTLKKYWRTDYKCGMMVATK